MNVAVDNIPAELKELRQWVIWREEDNPKDPTKKLKVPCSPLRMSKAMVNDPGTWGTYEDAIRDPFGSGVGFVFSKDDPYVGVDIDDCIDENGVISPEALEIIQTVNSYTEVSPSGRGIHIIAMGSIPQNTKRGKLEFYERDRYFTMTGRTLTSFSQKIEMRVVELRKAYPVVPGQKKNQLPMYDEAPADSDGIYDNCAWFRHCKEDADSLLEPEWYAMLSILAHCKDGASVAHKWSEPYPGYNKGETERKFKQAGDAAGPRTCMAVQREFDSGEYCAQCKFFGKITSPIQLGKPKARSQVLVDPGVDGDETPAEPGNLADGYHATDVGNANRIVAKHGSDILWFPQWREAMVWNGKRWLERGDGKIHQFAREISDGLIDQLMDPEIPGAMRLQMFKWALASESSGRIAAAASLAKLDPRVELDSTEQINSDKLLLNTLTATVDLRTGTAYPHRREDYITEMTSGKYSPGAECPTWLAFLDSQVPTQEVRDFLQRACGYTLTGLTVEKCLFFLYGPSNSGKTTFTRTIARLLGSYAKPVEHTLLMAKDYHGHPTEVANLFGARMATSSEVEEGARLAESFVKNLTGEDDLTARRMREDFWSFTPSHKFWITGNHKPVIRGTDDAIWNRVHIIEFSNGRPDDQQDKFLQFKLEQEFSGILNWAIEGCVEWARDGLRVPESVASAKKQYRSEMDVLSLFMDDWCEKHEQYRETKDVLYQSYKAWSDETSAERWPMTKQQFNRRLSERGYQTDVKDGRYVWMGIRLKSQDLRWGANGRVTHGSH